MPHPTPTSDGHRPPHGKKVTFTPIGADAPRAGTYDRGDDCFREAETGTPWDWAEVESWSRAE